MKQVLSCALLVCASLSSLPAQAPLAIVNGATFQSRFPLAPGSYAQIFGELSGAIPDADADLSQLPLPESLGGVQVRVEGVAARLYAVRANVAGEQDVIAFLVPQNTQEGRRPVEVLLNGQTAGQGSIDVIASSPGIFFSRGADGLDLGGVLNQSNQFAVEATPARRGETVQIYLTGQGTNLTAAVEDGNVPPAGTLVRTTTDPEVHVSVDKAEVQFSGVHGLFPGLWQVNAVVPDRPYIRGPVYLRVAMNGVVSNQVVFWVAE
ncbi:MAG: hypothetical protein KIT09_27525 [Bryobacteraceae bacterium]|nr:hypothetical protein [Bryobacteraceae bacterium]